MMKETKKQSAKIGKVMHEYKAGSLHSGKGGPVVKSRKQAVAIAMSQANMAKTKANKNMTAPKAKSAKKMGAMRGY
jgi:ribosomal protein L21E